MTVTWPKIEIFKIQDGGGRHHENSFFGHNSSTDCPISAKFRTRRQSGMSTKSTWQKPQFFLNPRWRTAAILKIVKSPYLSQKSSDFGVIWYTISDIKPDYSHVTNKFKFLPRDAMHKRGLCCHAVSVCLSVRPSRSWITSKRINISSKFFHHRVATPF